MDDRPRLCEAVRAALAPQVASWEGSAFPRSLWERLGEAGLLGACVPAHKGGGGQFPSQAVAIGAALVRESGSVGLGLAWLLHELVGRFVLYRLTGSARSHLLSQLLQPLIRGQRLFGLAISEPGVGAHPKHMSARAVRAEGGWVLDGDKVNVTNGPDADLFIVIAVSGQAGARKRFSAYLVPAGCRGLSRQDLQSAAVLPPLRQCSLRLAGCVVPTENLIGEEGTAFETLAKPLRDVEDALICSLLVGGMDRQLAQLAHAASEHPGGMEMSGIERGMLGALHAELSALAVLARDAARLADNYEPGSDLFAINCAFRRWARTWQEDWATLAARLRLGRREWDRMQQDFDTVLGIARRVSDARQQALGEHLLGAERTFRENEAARPDRDRADTAG